MAPTREGRRARGQLQAVSAAVLCACPFLLQLAPSSAWVAQGPPGTRTPPGQSCRLAGQRGQQNWRCAQVTTRRVAEFDFESVINITVNLGLAALIGQIFFTLLGKKELYPKDQCLPGRKEPLAAAPPDRAMHILLSSRLYPPFPEDAEMITFGMGCFWCSENLFMRLPRGVFSTAVGYAGGETANPSYEEVCSGKTNHAEVVRVVYRPSEVSLRELLQKFWEGHDPTTQYRQGNDFGTMYRSAIYCYSEAQLEAAQETRDQFQQILAKRGINDTISTEIAMAGEFYYAEGYHQQYDARGNSGYCGLRPTGASFLELESQYA